MTPVMMPEKRIFAKSGHICMICGFRARTKNKYRELQDHLVRQHFQDRIKAALPTRRPFMCPDKSCTVEGKDWQALMRHYTGKHGILEAYLKEVLASGILSNKENYVHRGHPSKLQQNRAPRMGSRRKKRPSTTSSASSSISSSGGHEGEQLLQACVMPDQDHETELDSEMIESGQYVSQDEQSVLMNPLDATVEPYHTLEVDDTELAEYPTHLALVLKRPKIGKNGEVDPTSLEETYAFVDLKYFMPISANKYIMKSHVDLNEPGVAFTLPHFPMSSTFLGENDPTQSYAPSMTSQSISQATTYYEAIPPQFTQESILLTSDVHGERNANAGMVMAPPQATQILTNGDYPYTTTCGQTLIQSYTVPSPHQHQNDPAYSQIVYGNYGGDNSSTASSPHMNTCYDQVVPSVSTADSPSPPALSDQSQHQYQQQGTKVVLPCPMECPDHGGHQEQQALSYDQQILQHAPQSEVQLQVRHSPPLKTCTSASSTESQENIIAVSKVIVEAANSIPIEGQGDLHHHVQQPEQQQVVVNPHGMKQIDFCMF